MQKWHKIDAKIYRTITYEKDSEVLAAWNRLLTVFGKNAAASAAYSLTASAYSLTLLVHNNKNLLILV